MKAIKDAARGLAAACSMFSIIPVPNMEFTGQSLRYALCFFPLIGAVIGAASWGWLAICGRFGVSPALYAAVMCALPVVVSGGIHMDGFIDTCDAVFSRRGPAERLAILKDPHVGAFGAAACALYFILQFGLWSQIYAAPRFAAAALCGFAVSRVFAGLCIVYFPLARDAGLARLFGGGAGKKPVIWAGALIIILIFAWILTMNIWLAAALAAACALLLPWFARFSKKAFGGVTGDLAGCLVQLTELMITGVCAVGGLICLH